MIRKIGSDPRRDFVRRYALEIGRTVRLFIYPFGTNKDGSAVISSRFKCESEIDAWIGALKTELDDAAQEAKLALRECRSSKPATGDPPPAVNPRHR